MNIAKLSEFEFAETFGAIRSKILQDPIKYFVKDSKFINFTPTPAQTVALKCIFGQKLDDVTKYPINVETLDDSDNFDLTIIELTEVQLYEQMTGFAYDFSDTEEALVKNRINLIVGRRAGKSTISAIIALFSTFKVNWRPYLKKTPVATVAILSHSVEFSQEILDILKGMVDESPVLTRLKNPKRKDTQSTFHLKIPFIQPGGKIEYSEVAIKVGAASKKTTRGRAVCTLLCDEIAFWNIAENAAESDTDILRAIRPALLQFGEHATTIKLSSPAIKQGVLYEEWERRLDLKDDVIQFKAPSWVWNTILPKEEFKKEWRSDPDGFDTEFRANFVDSISNFILPEFVDLCVVKGAKVIPPAEEKNVIYTAAIDAAFKSDKFAFALVGNNNKRVTLHSLKLWQGSRKDPVKVFEVAKYIRTVCREYGVSNVIADQYAYQPLKEVFEKFGISLIENTFSLPYKRKIYFSLKRLIHNQNISLLDEPILHKEIKELQVEQTPTGQIRIGHPPRGTDDAADALAVAAHASLEKSGTMGLVNGELVLGNDFQVKTDMFGKAFTAPSPEMLADFMGTRFYDNSREWTKDPETGKMVKVSELEDADIIGTDGADFIF